MDNILPSVHEANLMRDFVKHPGFSILQREVQKKLVDARNEWLKADKEKAEEIRLQSKAWGEIEIMLKQLILKGDAVRFAEQQKNQ